MTKYITLLCALTALISCQKDQPEEKLKMGNLTMSKINPHPGDQVEISYTPYSASASKEPAAYLYYLTGDKIRPEDLPLTKNGEKYTAEFKIPDSVTAIAFDFKNDQTFDSNNAKGYVMPLYTAENEEISSGKVSVAYFKLSQPSEFGYAIPLDSAFAVMNGIYQKDPTAMADWDMTLINLANQADKAQADAMIEKKLKGLKNKNELSDEEYTDLIRLYQIKKNESAIDSINKKAIEAYPKGASAQGSYVTKMQKTKGIEAKKEVYEAYEKNIGKPGYVKDYMLSLLADAYVEKGDFENFKKYSEIKESKTSVASLYNNVAWDLVQNGKNLDFAEEISKKSIDLLDEAEMDTDSKPSYYTQSQFKKSLQGSKMMYADTYAYILFKEGEIKEALNYQELAIGDKENPEVNERYVQYLLADMQFDKAKTEAEDFIKENTGTGKIKEYLETAYKETETNNKDFSSYLAALEKTGKEKVMAHLKESMIDEKAPQFTLTNLDGEQVALADLKGKTVILDFWATWCGPCKSSFPGMQMAVDKFKDDPGVEFLFVDTWESNSGEERHKSVNNFIKENKYTFHVLMDAPTEEGGSTYTVVSDYGVDGIPTKFVLGPDGRIKFKSVGFEGSTEGLADEMEMMIELTKS